MNKNIIKKGYEIVKLILDNDYESPYYFIVGKNKKYSITNKIIKCSKKWSLGEIDNSKYSCFDDYLKWFIKKNKLNIYQYNIEEFVE